MSLICKSAEDRLLSGREASEVPDTGEAPHSYARLSRREFLYATGAVLAAVGFGGGGVYAEDKKPFAKVGVLLCDKGPHAAQAASVLLGMETHLKDKSLRGGLFEILKADVGPLGEKTVEAVTELTVNRGARFIVSPPGLEGAEHAVQALAGGKVIHFVTCRSVRLVAGEMCLPEAFRLSGNSYQVSAPLAPWAVKTLGLRVFLTGTDDALGNESADAFGYFFEKSGGSFTDRMMVPPKSEDFGEVLDRVKKIQPDFVFASFGDPQGHAFLKALRKGEARLDTPVIGPEFLTPYPKTPGPKADEFDGVKTLSTLKNPKETSERIKKKLTKTAPPYVGRFAEGHDIASVISESLRLCGGSAAETVDLVKSIEGLESEGMRGKFRFDANHEIVLSGYVLGWELKSRGWDVSVLKDLGPIESPDFGCGRVGFPKGPETEVKTEEDPLEAIEE